MFTVLLSAELKEQKSSVSETNNNDDSRKLLHSECALKYFRKENTADEEVGVF